MRGKAHGHAELVCPVRHALALRNTMAAQVVAPTAVDDAWHDKGTLGNGTRSSMGVSHSVLSKGPPLCSLLAAVLLPHLELHLQKQQALFHECPNWSGAA